MDSSHLAQHAGTAGALFASIFLVATSTMKTMIPLRLFSILTNLVLIATAIPTHNFLIIPVQAAMLVLNSYRLHQMLQLVRGREGFGQRRPVDGLAEAIHDGT